MMRLKVKRYAIPADAAPDDPVLTPYDIEHMITYFRVLDANAEGADWREVSKREPSKRTRAIWPGRSG